MKCDVRLKYHRGEYNHSSLPHRSIKGRALFTDRMIFTPLSFLSLIAFVCSRLGRLSLDSVEMELLRIWLMACHLLSLWFSHTQAMRNQKTSPRISCMHVTLRELVGFHSPSSPYQPARLVVTVLHHLASAKQVSGWPMGQLYSRSGRADPSAANWQATSALLGLYINPC